MKKTLITLFCALSFLFTVTACNKQGPAEELGEKVDNKINQIEDKAVDRGPLEKAADRVEDAAGQ